MKFYSPSAPKNGNGRARPAFIDGSEFALFLNGLPNATAFLELDGRIRLVNVAFERLLSISRAGLLGTDLTRYGRTGDDLLQGVATALTRLQRFEGRGKVAGQANVSGMLSILRSAEGTPYGALLVLTPADLATGNSGGTFRFLAEERAAIGSDHVASPAHTDAERRARKALAEGFPLLVAGETGTGKTAFIRRLAGSASDRPLVHVICGSLTEANFTTEMLGQDGPTGRRQGLVEAASKGTLFLDHIDDLAPALQARLLAVLENAPELGGARLVSAASCDLGALVAKGGFRADLFYRIAAVKVTLPSLRDEPDMISALTDGLLARINRRRSPALSLSPAFRQQLLNYDFPGNIRELENILAHASASAERQATSEDFVTPPGLPIQPSDGDLRSQVQSFEDAVIREALSHHKSKRSAAKALGIDVATLIRKTGRSRTTNTDKE
ncbi:sigma-54-dependent Fis family transcriptional regulator [Paracoccus aestuariivivens]|uniref:HTH-type transcriptional regulatory protein TyrR n=1 Tax=Paracoccus aestuariivivens TaxID=1820333 RepID=A0A6L6JG84_9RHOB|nr:sigma 54-interacting transcriptional regulator [Paracoccus aestuariivivens]MTH79749.1 AAA domain-containing protein [Paracoccus aestuariivivens]